MAEQRVWTGSQWVELRVCPVQRILALRRAELRPGRAMEEARCQGDHDAGTRHYAAFEAAGAPEGADGDRAGEPVIADRGNDDAARNDADPDKPIGCASCMPSEWAGAPAYQLRGMAVRADRVGRGVGRALLRFAERDTREATGIDLLWCNARLHAVGFYEKHGWTPASAVFEIPGVGPHRRMVRRLGGDI